MVRKPAQPVAQLGEIEVRAMATAFQALADPVRLSIVLALVNKKQLTPSELAQALGRRAANISVNLRLLSMAGLVVRGARGKTSPYRVDVEGLERVGAMLSRCNPRIQADRTEGGSAV
jgi:DNA-binding transcriptional ArsR family regulator